MVFSLCFLPVSAASGDSFTHVKESNGSVSVIYTKESYTATKAITSATLGLNEAFNGLVDIFCCENGLVYLLCSENSQVIVLNKDYTLKESFYIKGPDGENINFTGASGIFADENGDVYICDTQNARVLIADKEHNYYSEIKTPDSPLIPTDFLFQPHRIIKDEKGYLYILSEGCYYGALRYTAEREFLGFYGSNTVATTGLDTLSFLWDKLTGNDVKKAGSTKKLPYSFVDISLDTDNYVVTCTGITESNANGMGQIRKISPTGDNILFARNLDGTSKSSDSMNFLEDIVTKKNNKNRPQNIISVDVNKKGYIFALDKTFGLIYVYDEDCNLITAFGGGLGVGNRLGLFQVPEAIAVHGDAVLVADSETKSVTVFKVTDFGNLLQTAQSMYLAGDYEKALPYWQEVISLDCANQLAYKGMAMAEYNNGNYDIALNYAKQGMDFSVYDMAYQAKSEKFIGENFIFLMLILLILIGGLIAVFVILKKKEILLIKSEKIKALFSVCFHPFESFDNIKYKKQGSVVIASILSILLFISLTLKGTCSGFLFKTEPAKNYNVLVTLAQSVGLILLWSVANWLVSTLMSGKGTLKEVFVSTTYAISPIIVFFFAQVVLSHFLPYSGMALVNGVFTAICIYVFFLLSIAMMTVHEYGFFKFLVTGLLSIVAMILVVFIIFMVIILCQQLWNFIYSIAMEVMYR